MAVYIVIIEVLYMNFVCCNEIQREREGGSIILSVLIFSYIHFCVITREIMTRTYCQDWCSQRGISTSKWERDCEREFRKYCLWICLRSYIYSPKRIKEYPEHTFRTEILSMNIVRCNEGNSKGERNDRTECLC